MFKYVPILTVIFSLNLFGFQEVPLPRVYTEPSLGIAEYEIQQKAYKLFIKFWNVGEIYDKAHGVAKLEIAGSVESVGRFEGGPNGKFYFDYKGKSLTLQMIEGRRIKAPGLLDGDKYFTVSNPNIFANWDENREIPGGASQEIRVSWEEGSFNGFHGEVMVKENENAEWTYASLKTIIKPGFYIRTGKESTAKIRFPGVQNGDSILGPLTEIKIHKPEEKTTWSILRGRIWNNIKKMWKDGTMEIEDTFQTGGVRGTIFVVEEINGQSSIKVIEGAVECKPKDGKPALITAGKAIVSQDSKTGSIIDFDANAETRYWDSVNNKFDAKPFMNFPKIFLVFGIIGIALFSILLLTLIVVLILRKQTG